MLLHETACVRMCWWWVEWLKAIYLFMVFTKSFTKHFLRFTLHADNDGGVQR